MAASELDEFMQRYHLALDRFFAGDPGPSRALYSQRDDATLANPFGPIARGWDQILEATRKAALNYREGGVTGFELFGKVVTSDLAYVVEVERFRAKVGASNEFATGALRVTSVLRREEGDWKIVHRHADPITAARPAESVIQPGS